MNYYYFLSLFAQCGFPIIKAQNIGVSCHHGKWPFFAASYHRCCHTEALPPYDLFNGFQQCCVGIKHRTGNIQQEVDIERKAEKRQQKLKFGRQSSSKMTILIKVGQVYQRGGLIRYDCNMLLLTMLFWNHYQEIQLIYLLD